MSSLINLGFACPPAFASPKHFDVNNFWNQQKRIRIGFLNDGLEAIHLPKAFGEPTKFRFYKIYRYQRNWVALARALIKFFKVNLGAIHLAK